jgi:hypothetical protein
MAGEEKYKPRFFVYLHYIIIIRKRRYIQAKILQFSLIEKKDFIVFSFVDREKMHISLPLKILLYLYYIIRKGARAHTHKPIFDFVVFSFVINRKKMHISLPPMT